MLPGSVHLTSAQLIFTTQASLEGEDSSPLNGSSPTLGVYQTISPTNVLTWGRGGGEIPILSQTVADKCTFTVNVSLHCNVFENISKSLICTLQRYPPTVSGTFF